MTHLTRLIRTHGYVFVRKRLLYTYPICLGPMTVSAKGGKRTAGLAVLTVRPSSQVGDR